MSAPSLPGLLVSHWQLTPVVLGEVGVAGGLYMAGAARLGARWPLRRTAAFGGGLGVLVLALQSGIDTYDDRLLSVHMVQHMLLLLAVPLLLLWGQPVTLALRCLHGERRRALAQALDALRPATRPWYCLGAFGLVVLLTHVPGFYDLTLRHPAVHGLEHVLYLAAGTLLWWPLVDGDPVLTHRLSGLGRLLYLLVGMVPMAVIGAYLNRHPSVVYAPYGAAARALGVSAVSDQATAGAVMWVVGNTTMVLVGLWAVMAAMSAEERRQQARETYARRGAIGADTAGALPAPRSKGPRP